MAAGSDPAEARKPQARALASRETIVLTAARAFADHGYHHASISRMVASMDLTEGAIYHHFKNKAQLAVAVLEELYRRWERVRDGVTQEAAARGLNGLEAIGLLHLRIAESYQNDLVIQAGTRLGYERDLIPTALPTPFVGWYPFLDQQLLAAQRQGLVRADLDRQVVARAMVASVLGIQDVSRRTVNRADLVERVAEWWDLLVRGLESRG